MSPTTEEKFPITAAQLSGNFSETLFYGMYLVTCCLCGHTLLFTGSGRDERLLRPHEIRWLMVFIALILFGICTFDVTIGLLHNFHAFIDSSSPREVFLETADWINTARSANQFIAILIGDFVLIYRCWIIHGRRWLVIVPSLILYLGSIATTIKPLQVASFPKIQQAKLFLGPWLLSFFVISVVQNVLTTGIMIWRIWRVDSQISRHLSHTGSLVNQPRYLRRVIRIIAESGAAYTLMLLLTVIAACTRSNAVYPISDMTLQTTGITFNVILIRALAGRERQFTEFDRNGRTLTPVVGQGAAGSAMIGPLSFSHQPHGRRISGGTSEDLEMGAKPSRCSMDQPSETDIYPRGITVTKVVHSA